MAILDANYTLEQRQSWQIVHTKIPNHVKVCSNGGLVKVVALQPLHYLTFLEKRWAHVDAGEHIWIVAGRPLKQKWSHWTQQYKLS